MAKLLKYEIDAVVEEIYCKLKNDLKLPDITKDPLYIKYSKSRNKSRNKIDKLKLELDKLNKESKAIGDNLLKKHNLSCNNFYGHELDKVFDLNFTNSKNISKDRIKRKVILSNSNSLKDIITDVIAQINKENY